ncbi:unnamed protein product [Owenia fusiformis]|uniref:Ig-like domain-containing protein n=1 Tax=Owenia fusiformis TaxID=6347 RepID=A0A8S4NBP8_OWEFU|nr:unnamed protein product [Owenia fusiformis]
MAELLFKLILILVGVSGGAAIHHECGWTINSGYHTADCVHRELVAIPDNLPDKIQVLHFEENNLQYLGDSAFRRYLDLVEIYLKNNKIGRISPDAFRGIIALKILNLEGNKLSEVPSEIFGHFESLRILNLKNNPIKVLTDSSFPNLSSLEKLVLENCHLSVIHPNALYGLSELKDLSLANNQLTEWESNPDTETQISKLLVLRIYRNPWQCSCKIRWLKQFLDKSNVNWNFGTDTPVCARPALLTAIKWADLRPQQFACRPEILSNSSNFDVVEQKNATIMCKIYADPKPRITWYKDSIRIDVSHQQTKYNVSEPGSTTLTSYLFITKLSLLDTGEYKCEAQNSGGTAQVLFKLNVSPKHFNYDDLTSLLQAGSIFGITAGVLLVIILLAILFIYGYRRYRQRKQEYNILKLKHDKLKTVSDKHMDKEPSHTNGSPFKSKPHIQYTVIDNMDLDLEPMDASTPIKPTDTINKGSSRDLTPTSINSSPFHDINPKSGVQTPKSGVQAPISGVLKKQQSTDLVDTYPTFNNQKPIYVKKQTSFDLHNTPTRTIEYTYAPVQKQPTRPTLNKNPGILKHSFESSRDSISGSGGSDRGGGSVIGVEAPQKPPRSNSNDLEHTDSGSSGIGTSSLDDGRDGKIATRFMMRPGGKDEYGTAV